MLTSAMRGMFLIGRVDSVSDVQHREGKTQKGSDYSFYQQTATLTLGGSMVEVVYRADKDPGAILCPLGLDELVRVKVENPRIFNGKVSFDIAR